MAAPRFELPDALRRLFRGGAPRPRGSWGRWTAAVRDVTARHRVLPLVVDADGLLALDGSGRVVSVRWTSGATPAPIEDLRTRDLAVLRALCRYGELAALVPTREPGDMDCRCRGATEIGSVPPGICFCGGLGFFPSRWREEADYLDAPAPAPASVRAEELAVALATRRPTLHALSLPRPAPTQLALRAPGTRGERVRRLALAVILVLVCGALVIGWTAWA